MPYKIFLLDTKFLDAKEKILDAISKFLNAFWTSCLNFFECLIKFLLDTKFLDAEEKIFGCQF